MALPLPRVVSDMPEEGRILAGMKHTNALTKQSLENKYYGPLAQADMMSKIAYAQYRPAEIAAQMMLSPAFRTLDPRQQNALIQRYASNLQQPTMQMPNMGGGGGMMGSPRGDGALNALLDYFKGPQPQSQNPMMQPGGMGGGNGAPQNPFANPSNGYAYNPDGTNQVASPAEVAQAANRGAGVPIGANTPAAQQAAGMTVPGSVGGYGPIDTANAQAKAAETAITGQAQNQNEQQKQRSLVLSSQSQIATDALKALEAFDRNYDKSSYKGQYLGSRPTSGPGSIPTLPGGTNAPEQLADRYANQFLTTLSGLGDTPAGRTDEGRSLIAAGKVDLSLEPDAKKELVDSYKAKLNRMINLRNFANDFYKKNPNATDEELVAMMNAYNKYAPSYDYENGKALPENEKKFRDFTSPQALESYLEMGDYNPYEKKTGSSANAENNAAPVEGTIEKVGKVGNQEYYMINGSWHKRKS